MLEGFRAGGLHVFYAYCVSELFGGCGATSRKKLGPAALDVQALAAASIGIGVSAVLKKRCGGRESRRPDGYRCMRLAV